MVHSTNQHARFPAYMLWACWSLAGGSPRSMPRSPSAPAPTSMHSMCRRPAPGTLVMESTKQAVALTGTSTECSSWHQTIHLEAAARQIMMEAGGIYPAVLRVVRVACSDLWVLVPLGFAGCHPALRRARCRCVAWWSSLLVERMSRILVNTIAVCK